MRACCRLGRARVPPEGLAHDLLQVALLRNAVLDDVRGAHVVCVWEVVGAPAFRFLAGAVIDSFPKR